MDWFIIGAIAGLGVIVYLVMQLAKLIFSDEMEYAMRKKFGNGCPNCGRKLPPMKLSKKNIKP